MDSTGIKKDILGTLTYFSLFDYPLKKGEIYHFLQNGDHPDDFEQSLASLLYDKAIFKIAGFYSLYDDISLAIRRMKGNENASAMMKRAERSAAIISAFPFVQGVAVSGSLSKHFADEQADIDFFIITRSSRLWICRTLLHLFKKFTFLFRKEHDFCMNYFIDEADLSIREKNIYTAIEATTIIPLRGTDVFVQFFEANRWAGDLLPNKLVLTQGNPLKNSWIRKFVEKLLDNSAGERFDNFLMRWTTRNWNAKTRNQKRDIKQLILGMHTGKHFAKPRPDRFQKPLLEKYYSRLNDVCRQYELSGLYRSLPQRT